MAFFLPQVFFTMPLNLNPRMPTQIIRQISGANSSESCHTSSLMAYKAINVLDVVNTINDSTVRSDKLLDDRG